MSFLWSAISVQRSLSDPAQGSVLVSAAKWVEGVLTGSIATVIASLAIAFLGFAMLSGRIDVKRGMTVLLGCFILFGASAIAKGLKDFANGEQSLATQQNVPPPPAFPKPPATAEPKPNSGYDPYAGASPQR